MPVYGLLGRKLGHSWSETIHKALGCSEYRLIELEPEALAPFFKNEDIKALNVTIPYKKDVMAFCDVIDSSALEIGSVNTIVRRDDGKLYAWNTDLIGFRYMVKRAGITLNGKKVLVLGSGGSSLTAIAASKAEKASSVTIISRSGENNYSNLHLHADAEIIINTTPVGMFPRNGETPLDLELFPKLTGVIDIVYNPRRTALLIQAAELGIPHTDGLPMLVSQAVAAEELFFNKKIDSSETEKLIAELRRRETNIVLIGMPGCGKSTVGQLLADKTGREAIDIDAEIEKLLGCSIPEVFREKGEDFFRQIEREETERVGKLSGRIIMTGGGVVKDIRNYLPLHQNGRIYQLHRPIDQLPIDGRPISQANTAETLYTLRAPLYARFRDEFIDNSGSPEAAADQIWRDFCEHSGD